jgi:hypothetical protein
MVKNHLFHTIIQYAAFTVDIIHFPYRPCSV